MLRRAEIAHHDLHRRPAEVLRSERLRRPQNQGHALDLPPDAPVLRVPLRVDPGRALRRLQTLPVLPQRQPRPVAGENVQRLRLQPDRNVLLHELPTVRAVNIVLDVA